MSLMTINTSLDSNTDTTPIPTSIDDLNNTVWTGVFIFFSSIIVSIITILSVLCYCDILIKKGVYVTKMYSTSTDDGENHVFNI